MTGIRTARMNDNTVDIYFDFHQINATEENLKPLRKKILKKSGGKIFLITVFASYGILTLKDNLSITDAPDGI